MSRPHLIFLMADQLRYDVLGAYGDHQCPTPGLDRLAERSTIFDRHYTPCPLCGPAHASILTGLSPRQHGALISGWFHSEQSFGFVKPNITLFPQILAEAGYRVVHVGIQLLRGSKGSRLQAAGVEYSGPASNGEHLRDLLSRNLQLGDVEAFRDPIIDTENGKPTVFTTSSPRPAIFPLREELFLDEVLATRMVEVVNQHVNTGDTRPLALFGFFWLPHPPLWAPKVWASKVAADAISLPPHVGKWFSGMPALQLANIPGQLGAHVSLPQWREIWAMYFGMVALMDRCVSRVLAAFDYAAMLDDSLVLFTSDHGDMLGSHRLYGKMCLYEEATRVPLLCKLPHQTSSRRVLEMTDHLDLVPTLADLAGISAPTGCAGRSLRTLAEGQPNHEPRLQTFAAYDGNAGRGFTQRMVRTATHKLIHNIGDRAELYDVIEDPRETRNLAGQVKEKTVEIELRDMLNKWMADTGDDAPRC
ncbi:MAG: sulfatase-like hydrolase/transferase [Phycisphaeraceae bacterium]|nr:sulfatase-like hydrolase/transferase [Phycisphaeraceae bacterium]